MLDERINVAFFDSRIRAVSEILTNPDVQAAVWPEELFGGTPVCHMICRHGVIADEINDKLRTQRGRDVREGRTVFPSQVFRGDKPTLKAELAAVLRVNIIE